MRPHLDYGDILYNQTFDNLFHERLESIQYIYIFLSPDRLSTRNGVTSDNANFRPDIRQTFFY